MQGTEKRVAGSGFGGAGYGGSLEFVELADAGFGVVHHFEEAGAGESHAFGGGLDFDEAAARRIRDYLSFKPKHKHGVHRYEPMSAAQVAENRPWFRRYQERYGVPDEDG